MASRVDTTKLKLSIERQAELAVAEATVYLLRGLEQRVPRGTNPRRGRRPLAQTRQVDRRPFGVTIRYTARHAGMLEHGTGPHVIRARPGKVLRFVWPAGPVRVGEGGGGSGRLYHFAKVNHPGSRSQVGWFSGVVNAGAWNRLLQRSFR